MTSGAEIGSPSVAQFFGFGFRASSSPPGICLAFVSLRMNENSPTPAFSEAQANAFKKKLRSLQWRPEAVMRETALIQRLREAALTDCKEE